MRYGTLLIATALAALGAASSAADARKRLGPATVLDILTSPIRALTQGGPAPRAYRHRGGAYAARHPARSRPEDDAPPATATVAAPPAAAVAAVPGSLNVYEDILGYALWPNDYAGRFWTRGYGDIMKSVVVPATAPASARDEEHRRGRRLASARARDANRGTANADPGAGMCSPQAKEQASGPIDRIERTLELTEAQMLKLQELRAAVAEAVERGKAACRDVLPRAPSDRLKAMMDGLWALRDADILFRTPLDRFYRSLTDEQKVRLGSPGTTAGGPPPAGATCGLSANDMPIEEITQSVRPTQEQRASLDMLQGMSADLSKYLTAACPQETPSTPVGRLDAAGERVTAMLYAAVNLDPALNGFYFQLSDEQRKKFDSLGR
jgi:LTXXQ motif family protein